MLIRDYIYKLGWGAIEDINYNIHPNYCRIKVLLLAFYLLDTYKYYETHQTEIIDEFAHIITEVTGKYMITEDPQYYYIVTEDPTKSEITIRVNKLPTSYIKSILEKLLRCLPNTNIQY